MTLEQLTKDVQTIAIICNQWGDSGKGKFVDYFAEWADVIVRGTGGNNAGHTIVTNCKKRIFHLVPSGILHKDKINILGNGTVIDLEVLVGELDELTRGGITYNNLMISEDAHVILPYHVKRDIKRNASQKKGAIGSTGRGIGPCYADKIARRGIMIRDLFNKDILAKKIGKAKEYYQEQDIDIEYIVEELGLYAERIKPFVRDTISEMHEFIRHGKKILLEGAQGLLLSIEFGTYPYVTSSDSSVNGVAAGVGLSAKVVDLPLGIVKFPYMTRVGAGPFPTEFGGAKSEGYCASGLEHDIKYELKNYRISFEEKNGSIEYNYHDPKIIELMNSNKPFLQGIGIRLAGEEYGATTGRPRRTGWTDLAALKYAIGINGPNIILTKADVVQGANEIKLGTGYNNSENFTRDSERLRSYKPEYQQFPGFKEDISQIKDYKDLPDNLRDSINFLERYTGAGVRIISTGPDRNQTIIKDL